jgi:hypothetical protein
MPHDLPRVWPDDDPAQLADEAVLLALLVTVHDVMRRPAHTLTTVMIRPPDTTRRRHPTIPPHPDARRLTLRRN